MRILIVIIALLAAPGTALAGNTTSSGAAAIASSIGSIAGTTNGSCSDTEGSNRPRCR